MTTIATTRLSSKGQIVIPEDIRIRLGLETGDQFVVYGDKGVVILKALEAPSFDEFDEIMSTARKQARAARVRASDVSSAIKKARRSK